MNGDKKKGCRRISYVNMNHKGKPEIYNDSHKIFQFLTVVHLKRPGFDDVQNRNGHRKSLNMDLNKVLTKRFD